MFDLCQELIKYRKRNNMSQECLGEKLGVSAMAISRIETGRAARLTNDFVSRALELLECEFMEARDERISAKKAKSEADLKRAQEMQAVSEKAVKEHRNTILEMVDRQLNDIGYTRIGLQNAEKTSFYLPDATVLYYNDRWDKYWLISLDDYRYKNPVQMIQCFALRIGFATFLERVNGVSVLTESDRGDGYIEYVRKSAPAHTEFDITVLTHNHDRVNGNYPLNTCFDGTGLFDLHAPNRNTKEKEQILLEYGKFNAALHGL